VIILPYPDNEPGQYFTWVEMTRTGSGLKNVPDSFQKNNIRVLVQTVLDPLRAHLDRPVRVTSGFRCKAVNTRIGGSKTSQHMRGEAADIKVRGLDAKNLIEAILLADVPFDQVIGYAPSRGGHVHISVRVGAPTKNRRQILWAPAGGGYRSYQPAGSF
jgi:hypothetical protein